MLSAATKEAVATTVRDAKTTAFSAKRDLRDATEGARTDLTEIAANAGSQLRNFIDTAGERFTEASDKITDEVKTNPVRSSAIALGVGFLLGAILRK